LATSACFAIGLRAFAAVDAQPRNVHGFRRFGICDLNDLLKVFVGLRLARAYLSRKSPSWRNLRIGCQHGRPLQVLCDAKLFF
jgi:hypothetical protein